MGNLQKIKNKEFNKALKNATVWCESEGSWEWVINGIKNNFTKGTNKIEFYKSENVDKYYHEINFDLTKEQTEQIENKINILTKEY